MRPAWFLQRCGISNSALWEFRNPATPFQKTQLLCRCPSNCGAISDMSLSLSSSSPPPPPPPPPPHPSAPPFPSRCFENLPVELHWLILRALPDFSSLRSVVLASQSAHAAYTVSIQSIQRDIFRRVLSDSPELLELSSWLHRAFHGRRSDRDYCYTWDEFLAYRGSYAKKKPEWFPVLSIETVLAEGLRFHLIVEDITAAFLQSAMHSYQNRRSAPPKGPKGKFRHLPLQHAECTRIQRALYRFQLICEMEPSTAPMRSLRRSYEWYPLFHFAHRFPTWEVEELCCIYRYLVQRWSFLAAPACKSVVGADVGDDPASYRSVERVASMGLIFLQDFETATPQTRLQLLKKCSPVNPVLSDVLDFHLANASARMPTHTKMLGRGSLLRPSPGMALYQAEHPNTPGAEPLNQLQEWGYCFWDSDRLDAWDVYDSSTEEPDCRAVILQEAQRNRAKMPTASRKVPNLPRQRSWTKWVPNLGTSLQLWRRP